MLRCHHSFSPFMSKQSTKVHTASRDFLSLQNTANYLFAKSMWWMMLLASEASTSLSTIFSKFLSHHLRNGSKTSASHDRRAPSRIRLLIFKVNSARLILCDEIFIVANEIDERLFLMISPEVEAWIVSYFSRTNFRNAFTSSFKDWWSSSTMTAIWLIFLLRNFWTCWRLYVRCWHLKASIHSTLYGNQANSLGLTAIVRGPDEIYDMYVNLR